MPTYLALINFTEQGVQNFVDTRRRAEDFRARARQAGVNVREILWTMGQFDGALLLEAPDDETVTGVMLGLAALGNVRTRTLRAFDVGEIGNLLSLAGGGAAGRSAGGSSGGGSSGGSSSGGSSGGNGGSRGGESRGGGKKGRR
ncbi:MAG TPA: GYD domain-containing protein [Tepidisphaeraceae bacterium]|nr:GYD domain-containing protein [Tepidisphaeraceae bacterium]